MSRSTGTFLGLDGGGWTKLLFGFVVAALVAVGGVGLSFHDRISKAEAAQELHEAAPLHQEGKEWMRSISRKLDDMRTQQIVNTTKLDTIWSWLDSKDKN